MTPTQPTFFVAALRGRLGPAILLAVVAGSAAARPVDPKPELMPAAPDLQVNVYTTGHQASPDVASFDDGFVVTWDSYGSPGSDQDGSSIQARRFDSGGLPLGDQFQVNTYTTQSQSKAAVAAWPDGRFVVAWKEYQDEVRGRLFDSIGVPVTDFSVESAVGVYSDGDLAVTDSSFLVVWSTANDGSSFGISGRRFETSGTPLGASFKINSYTTNLQANPRVAATPNNGFVVVWGSRFAGPGSDDYAILMRRLDSLGTPLGEDFQVNSHTSDRQYRPAVAAATDGGFVISWTSADFPGDSCNALVARRFDSSGDPIGLDFQVEQELSGFQILGDVGTTPDGGFLVAWDGAADGSGDASGAILASRFTSAGSRLGDDFLVNSHTTGIQTRPAATIDARGNMAIVWDSTSSSGDDAGGRSIQARLLLAEADVGVSKSNGVEVASAGGQVTYTVVAFNDGPDAATGVRLVDSLSTDLTCTWTSAAAAGVTGNTPAGNGDLDETLLLPPDASVTYTLGCEIDAGASGTLLNVATISAEQLDENASNDAAADMDEITDLFADGFESGNTSAWSESLN